MTYNDVYDYFKDEQNVDPPYTSELVTKGYRQKSGGYIADAKKLNITNPTQWWHIMYYCSSKIKQGYGDKQYRYTPCGELLIYMAEKSNAIDIYDLKKLVNKIVNSNELDDRRKWNRVIKELCWNKIKEAIGN